MTQIYQPAGLAQTGSTTLGLDGTLNCTQWLCGSNLWPWLPVGWVGHLTLQFAFAHRSIKPSLQQVPVNLPYLHACWVRSVFKCYDYIAALFIPSISSIQSLSHVHIFATP